MKVKLSSNSYIKFQSKIDDLIIEQKDLYESNLILMTSENNKGLRKSSISKDNLQWYIERFKNLEGAWLPKLRVYVGSSPYYQNLITYDFLSKVVDDYNVMKSKYKCSVKEYTNGKQNEERLFILCGPDYDGLSKNILPRLILITSAPLSTA
jgi:hypothetical protein